MLALRAGRHDYSYLGGAVGLLLTYLITRTGYSKRNISKEVGTQKPGHS